MFLNKPLTDKQENGVPLNVRPLHLKKNVITRWVFKLNSALATTESWN